MENIKLSLVAKFYQSGMENGIADRWAAKLKLGRQPVTEGPGRP